MPSSRPDVPPADAPWATLIGALAEVQTRIFTMVFDPEPPATEVEIATVEAELRYRLPEQYREFLGQVGGWRSMFEETHALGPADLFTGELHRRGLQLLSGVTDEDLARLEITLLDLLPIAASMSAMDLFALIVRGPRAGSVVWSTGAQGAEVRVFPSVRTWLVGLIEDAEMLFAAINESSDLESPDYLDGWVAD